MTRPGWSSLFLACALATFAYGPSTAADDATPETAPPPPPSLAPETPPQNAAPLPAEVPPAKAEEDLVKSTSETPEPQATPSPETSEAASQEKSEEKKEDAAKAEVASEPEPAPSANTEDAREDNVIASRRDGHAPYYQTTHPAWGFEMSASIGALGNSGTVESSQNGSLARALEMQFEYQLPFLQAIGVISFGPSLAIYPIGTDGSVTNSPASIWGVGGQVRYQARFFHEQIIVPMVGYEYQQFTYHFADGQSGATPISGTFIGAMILLNAFEPSAAAELYVQNEISRSYLVAEYKQLNGADGIVNVGGGSLYFGFRLEF